MHAYVVEPNKKEAMSSNSSTDNRKKKERKKWACSDGSVVSYA